MEVWGGDSAFFKRSMDKSDLEEGLTFHDVVPRFGPGLFSSFHGLW